MGITRRELLRGGAAAGALAITRPSWALATIEGDLGAPRRSRLTEGTFLAHADLHNHSHLSDGAGDPTLLFDSIRSAAYDVAAVTDHSTLSFGAAGRVTEEICAVVDGEPTHGERQDCRSLAAIDEARWVRAKELADAADDPGRFVAMRGFEWSSPFLGHINVWLSERWIDPLHTAGIDSSGLGEHFREVPGAGDPVGAALDTVGRANPAHTGMIPFYEWLTADPSTPVLGGGADGLASFNHPGRETGRFSYFRYHEAVASHFVAVEMLNRREDHLFKSFASGQPSPLVECLNAGWRVGISGVSDEHGTDWGHPEGKGRTGLWVSELTRDGVAEALQARRLFATFLDGLRVDATALSRPAGPPAWAGEPGGGKTRMGGVLAHDRGPVIFEIDVDHPALRGETIEVQVLRPGEEFPEVAHVETVRVPAEDEAVISVTVDLDAADGDWVVLRLADPARPNEHHGPDGHAGNAAIIAYASPFW
ncbi:MAG: hypothetical protein ACRDUY_11635, partial [Nitriliruptorales bacterium]